MNKKQKVVFLVGVGIMVLMGLIPRQNPWRGISGKRRFEQELLQIDLAQKIRVNELTIVS